MKSTIAIKRFIEAGSDQKLGMTEMLEFKKSMPPEEFDELGRQACDALGTEWEPSAA